MGNGGRSLAQIIAERKTILKEMGSLLKLVDTELERIERKIRSLRARKLKVPEFKDFEKLADMGDELDQRLTQYYKYQQDALDLIKAT